jgi:hypothetical protein
MTYIGQEVYNGEGSYTYSIGVEGSYTSKN